MVVDSAFRNSKSEMNADWRTRYDLAVEAARKAGDLARTFYESTFEVEHKADSSPVTIADKSAEGRVVSVLEGGYDLEGLSQSAAAHVTALMRG